MPPELTVTFAVDYGPFGWRRRLGRVLIKVGCTLFGLGIDLINGSARKAVGRQAR